MATERYATANVDLGGMTIPCGALVYVVLSAANRDDNAFTDAGRFDIGSEPTGISPSDTAFTTAFEPSPPA